jgi:hypothetical protein
MALVSLQALAASYIPRRTGNFDFPVYTNKPSGKPLTGVYTPTPETGYSPSTGFTWTGAEKVSRMAEWPDWHPPEEMIDRQPYLPRFMAGGDGNPLGARALYLGKTLYRIHGTNQPSTIGTFVSSGCVRLTNADIQDLFDRVKVGNRVVVLPGKPPATAQNQPPVQGLPPAQAQAAPPQPIRTR